MTRFDIQTSGTVAVLILPARLTSDLADKLQACLRKALNDDRRLIVDCTNVDVVDAYCLIILCTAFRLSKQQGREIILAGQRPDVFNDAAWRTRELWCLRCALDSDHGCLWCRNRTPHSRGAGNVRA